MKRKKRPPKKTGRPTMYDPDGHPRMARELTASGKTKQDIAEVFKIARSTLDKWRADHAEFSVAFDLGVEDATDRVEISLLEKASGYTRNQEKLITVAGPVGTGSQVERHLVEEHYPADTGAAKFWLTNRRKKQWSERSEVAVHGLEALVSRLAAARKRADEKTE